MSGLIGSERISDSRCGFHLLGYKVEGSGLASFVGAEGLCIWV